eukprot:scaffold451_cov365-Prasinococcus_capsulatus_cf.AAC.5
MARAARHAPPNAPPHAKAALASLVAPTSATPATTTSLFLVAAATLLLLRLAVGVVVHGDLEACCALRREGHLLLLLDATLGPHQLYTDRLLVGWALAAGAVCLGEVLRAGRGAGQLVVGLGLGVLVELLWLLLLAPAFLLLFRHIFSLLRRVEARACTAAVLRLFLVLDEGGNDVGSSNLARKLDLHHNRSIAAQASSAARSRDARSLELGMRPSRVPSPDRRRSQPSVLRKGKQGASWPPPPPCSVLLGRWRIPARRSGPTYLTAGPWPPDSHMQRSLRFSPAAQSPRQRPIRGLFLTLRFCHSCQALNPHSAEVNVPSYKASEMHTLRPPSSAHPQRNPVEGHRDLNSPTNISIVANNKQVGHRPTSTGFRIPYLTNSGTTTRASTPVQSGATWARNCRKPTRKGSAAIESNAGRSCLHR